MTHRTAMVDGVVRTYLVYLPQTDPRTPLPAVLVFHGYTMSGQTMFDVTEYAALADTEHIALAFPDGEGGPNTATAPWNVGAGVCPTFFGPPPNAMGNDFGLIDAIEADLAHDQCLDPAHIFATGFSMGGYLTHHLACMRDDIRGAAPHSSGTHDLITCTSGHKPIIILHGLGDTVIPPGCDDPSATAVAGVTPSAVAWAAKNGCATTTQTIAVQGGSCEVYDSCPADGQVELCTFPGMGHCWAGGPASAGVFACPAHAKATELEWEFFKQHAW